VFFIPVGLASKLGGRTLAYSREDIPSPDEEISKFLRGQEMPSTEQHRQGRASFRSSPPRVYRRTISSNSSFRQEYTPESTKSFAITAASAAAATTAASVAESSTTQEKTRVRQPIKRRTQRSHTDQLFSQTAPIAPYEHEILDDDSLEAEMEAFAAESESLVQALTLSSSPRARARAAGALGGAKDEEAIKLRGSKTLVRAKGQSKEKGLDKRKSRSRNTSCSQS